MSKTDFNVIISGNSLKIAVGIGGVFVVLAQVAVCIFLCKRKKLGNWIGCHCTTLRNCIDRQFGRFGKTRNETESFLMKEVENATAEVITFYDISRGNVRVPTAEEFDNLPTFTKNPDPKFKVLEGQKYNNENGLNLIPDVLPFDEHRVKLRVPINGCDYVNASWLSQIDQDEEHYNVVYTDKESDVKVKFILGQNPTPNARPHYYQMLYENLTRIVIQIKDEKDSRIPKIGHDREFCHMKRHILSRNKVVSNLYQSEIYLSNSNSPGNYRLNFTLFELVNWPRNDLSSSEDTSALMPAICFIRNTIKTMNNSMNIMVQDGEGGIAGASVLVVLFGLLQQIDDHYAHKFTPSKGQETAVDVFKAVNELRQFKDKMINSYDNYKLLFVCLAHYGKNRSKLGPTLKEENVDSENYELYEEQRLINLSPDTVINIEDDANNKNFEDLSNIDFAPNPISNKENSVYNQLYHNDASISNHENASDNENIFEDVEDEYTL